MTREPEKMPRKPSGSPQKAPAAATPTRAIGEDVRVLKPFFDHNSVKTVVGAVVRLPADLAALVLESGMAERA